MPEFDRIERGFNPSENTLSAEVESSLERLTGRLDTLTNDSLTARQAEMYYEGARHIKEHPEQYLQYQQHTDFIEKIINTYEDSLPAAETV